MRRIFHICRRHIFHTAKPYFTLVEGQYFINGQDFALDVIFPPLRPWRRSSSPQSQSFQAPRLTNYHIRRYATNISYMPQAYISHGEAVFHIGRRPIFHYGIRTARVIALAVLIRQTQGCPPPSRILPRVWSSCSSLSSCTAGRSSARRPGCIPIPR